MKQDKFAKKMAAIEAQAKKQGARNKRERTIRVFACSDSELYSGGIEHMSKPMPPTSTTQGSKKDAK
jgi:hypothetical protein